MIIVLKLFINDLDLILIVAYIYRSIYINIYIKLVNFINV